VSMSYDSTVSRRRILISLGVFTGFSAAISLLSACGGGAPATDAQPTTASAKPAATPPAASAAAQPTTAAAAVAAPTTAAVTAAQPAPAAKAGAKTEITVWDWHAPRVELMWNKWFPIYTKDHPDVTFKVTTVPYAEFWKKLIPAIGAKQAPDMNYFHGAQQEAMVNAGLLAPLPPITFPQSELEQKFPNAPAVYGPEGKPYWIPTGVMSGGIYYNKKMWSDAGLAEKDLPDTWDKLVDVAKKLTKKDAGGRVEVAGFDPNGAIESTAGYLTYQQGYWNYSEDYKHVYIDTPEFRRSIQYFLDLYDQHKVVSKDFLVWNDAFTSQKAAMVFGWSWFTGSLNTAKVAFDWGVSRSPSWNGDFKPAVGPGSLDPQSLVVPATTAKEKQSICFDVIKALYYNQDFLVDNALTLGSPPSNPATQENPKVKADATINALLPQTPYVITTIGGPPLLADAYKNIYEGIFKSGMSVDEGFKKAQQQADQIMSQGDWKINERSYQNASLMKFRTK